MFYESTQCIIVFYFYFYIIYLLQLCVLRHGTRCCILTCYSPSFDSIADITALQNSANVLNVYVFVAISLPNKTLAQVTSTLEEQLLNRFINALENKSRRSLFALREKRFASKRTFKLQVGANWKYGEI